MPRKARIVLPNTPHHVVHWGHNRESIFSHERDYRHYLENIWEWKEELGCKVYAYCLMPTHIHLIVDPCNNSSSLSQLMKRLAGRHTRYVNSIQNRSGSLWEGRFKSSCIDAENYLQFCCRYVELNPVRNKMVSHPEEYKWSSYRAKLGLDPIIDLDTDSFYRALGRSPEERAYHYRQSIIKGLSGYTIKYIESATNVGRPIGDQDFVRRVEIKLGRELSYRRQGRPSKNNFAVEDTPAVYCSSSKKETKNWDGFIFLIVDKSRRQIYCVLMFNPQTEGEGLCIEQHYMEMESIQYH